MKLHISALLAIVAFAVASLFGNAQTLAQNAYITNGVASTVSVINTKTNRVIATIPVNTPVGVAATSFGRVYVTNLGNNSVSVIDTNKVIATIFLNSSGPTGVAATPNGKKIYVANIGSNDVSVIDARSNAMIATISAGILHPYGVAVSPDGKKVYVANSGGAITFPAPPATVSVIDVATDAVVATIPFSTFPADVPGVAITPDGKKVYVTNEQGGNVVTVIDAATNAVITTVPAPDPIGVAVSPDGKKVYVAGGNVVTVIDVATDTVVATVPGFNGPFGISVTPDGTRVYVANSASNNVLVISALTDKVIDAIPVCVQPLAFGIFIPPTSKFAGTPGYSNCFGQSVSALAQQYHGPNGAAAALGFSSVQALQDAILAFCGG